MTMLHFIHRTIYVLFAVGLVGTVAAIVFGADPSRITLAVSFLFTTVIAAFIDIAAHQGVAALRLAALPILRQPSLDRPAFGRV